MEKQQKELLNLLNTWIPKQILIEISVFSDSLDEEIHFFLEKNLKIVATVRDNFRLPDSVIHVWIYYVMLKTDMRLTKAYVEKIAGHWGKVNKYPNEITLIDSIRGAIKTDLTDEKVGKYVKKLLVNPPN